MISKGSYIKAILCCVGIFIFTNTYSQNKLIVHIQNLKNDKGVVVLELCNSDKEIIAGIHEKIDAQRSTITIENLEEGIYSFRYFHDENENLELDTRFLGIPKEGFGFSNNAKGKFGPPKYEETLFRITKNKTMTESPTYF